MEHRIARSSGFPPRLGRELWRMDDCRTRTAAAVAGAGELVDWTGPGVENSVGTLLYHIAAIELDWIFCDVLETDFPAGTEELFPVDVRDDGSLLTPVRGESLERHLTRLSRTRAMVIDACRALTDASLDHVTSSGERASPTWVFHHLCQHEAEHRGQIMAALTLARSAVR